jgi:catechol 2,3-dioxygenase-like lactoylglutathione lyase family enzyme
MPVTDFPPLTHVALTVRDLSVSIPWYEALFDAKPVLDEDTDPDFHHTVYLLGNNTLLGLHQHARPAPGAASASSGSASTTSPSAAPTGRSLRSGSGGWTNWASPTARSRMPATARA